MIPNTDPCPCLESPQIYSQYQTIRSIGVDKTNGRYGDVELWQCKKCERYWLHYHVEYEHLTRSGRNFMGLITLEQAMKLRPDEAIHYLESLDWYLFSGSYFDGRTGKASGHVPVE